MSKRAIFITLGVIVILAGGYGIWVTHKPSTSGVACTMEAKLCPDGSYVGRSGPHCDFAACPTVTTTSVTEREKTTGTLAGTIMLSPTCPVERIPPDPACAPKPYASTVDISSIHGFFAELHADSAGIYWIHLVPGTYNIVTHQTSLYPRCESKQVTIIAGATTTADISCDTGIR